VVGALVGAAFSGGQPLLRIGTVHIGMAQYLAVAALGAVTGLVGLAFASTAGWLKRAWDAVWRWPEWLRPVVGGVVLGPLLLVLPELYGVGFPVVGNAVAGRYLPAFLLLLLVGKIVATSLTAAIGGAGGMFGPVLFIGAAAGAAFGELFDSWLPGVATTPAVFAVLGIAGVFAAAARAPVTAVVLGVELTGEYALLPALLVVTAAATVTARARPGTSLY
jgi:CIC family chloride channel protein